MAGQRWSSGDFWKLRIGRKHYWMGVGGVVLLSVVLGMLMPKSSGSAQIVPWMMLYRWRLHDFGRSGWWAALMIVAMFVITFGGFLVIGASNPAMLKGQQADLPTSFYMLLGAAVLLQLAFTIWLGVQPGDEGPNRYGVRLGEKTPQDQAAIFS